MRATTDASDDGSFDRPLAPKSCCDELDLLNKGPRFPLDGDGSGGGRLISLSAMNTDSVTW